MSSVWLAADGALLVEYEIGSALLGARFDLTVDPTSGLPATDPGRLASDLYHDLHTDPGDQAWVDATGRTWWGDEPEDGWRTVLLPERVHTVLRDGAPLIP
ncbi:hypothetical protein [Pseudonocardia sp. HH130630-07]|uniref:hypothetical protein n=1 Tax=Pseudonocardia sp. HH130630-07 TaxID=1690815 RepID=UPI000814F8E7|nr:hypothetical protein [Pseudonocardia sp. HH130630-07]ANY06944.1 hypothetical protein AFB00_12305 [Pseudonocardia sp. HH130630-07]